MMSGYGFGLWWLVMTLVPLAVLGLVVYWAVYSGVRKALGNRPPE